MGRRTLAKYVNSLGFKSKKGNAFETTNIRYILNNPVYVGKVRWTPTMRLKSGDYNNPESIVADGKHEPIITQETWDKTQACLAEDKELFGKRQKTTAVIRSWLSGLVKCGSCGKNLVAFKNKYLQCNSFLKGKCTTSQFVKVTDLEKLILAEIKNVYTENIAINVAPKKGDNLYEREYELINEALEKSEAKSQRIMLAYQDGIDTLAEYKENKQKVDGERKQLIEQLQNLKDGLLNMKNDEGINKELENAYALLADENTDLDLKYKTSHFLINEIVFDRKEKTLTLEYK